MKLLVGVPAYERKLYCETVTTLLHEQAICAGLGIEMRTAFIPGNSQPHGARDQLVREFTRSDFDRLFFLDADVACEPGSIIKVAMQPEDFVAAAYRYKDPVEGYPVFWEKPNVPIIPNKDTGLIEPEVVPAGFLALSRNVFAKFEEAFPRRTYTLFGEQFFGYFHCPPGMSEDANFCREWRSLGGKVWLDAEHTLTHVDGGRRYVGNYGDWLRKRHRENVTAAKAA